MPKKIPKIVRVAVIGVGHLGCYHAQKYAAMPGVDLVAVADINLAQAQKVAAETGTVAYSDYRELVGKVDAVSIATSTTSHFEVGAFCLRNGIDVMMEKPITTTLEEADTLVSLASEHERILQVGLIERFNPAMRAARERLTMPLFIEARRMGVFPWRSTDVDVILDVMIHDLDIILALVRSPIKSISAVGAPVITRHTDIANAHIVFQNGCAANISASRVSQSVERRMRLFQMGECLTIDFNNKSCNVVRLSAHPPATTLEPMYDDIAVELSDALEQELREFVHCARTRTPPEVTGAQGRNALAVALDVIRAVKQNNRTLAASLRKSEQQSAAQQAEDAARNSSPKNHE